MADDVQVGGVWWKADEVPAGAARYIGWSKISLSTDGALVPVDETNPFPIAVVQLPKSTGCGGGVRSIPAAAASANNVLSLNENRRRVEVQNISGTAVKLRFGGAASDTDFHRVLAPGETWWSEMPYCYKGDISAWHPRPTARELVVAEFT